MPVLLLALVLLAARNEFNSRRVLRSIHMAQADIDALAEKVDGLTDKVNNYNPPASTDGSEDLSGLQSSVSKLSDAIDAKLKTPSSDAGSSTGTGSILGA